MPLSTFFKYNYTKYLTNLDFLNGSKQKPYLKINFSVPGNEWCVIGSFLCHKHYQMYIFFTFSLQHTSKIKSPQWQLPFSLYPYNSCNSFLCASCSNSKIIDFEGSMHHQLIQLHNVLFCVYFMVTEITFKLTV